MLVQLSLWVSGIPLLEKQGRAEFFQITQGGTFWLLCDVETGSTFLGHGSDPVPESVIISLKIARSTPCLRFEHFGVSNWKETVRVRAEVRAVDMRFV